MTNATTDNPNPNKALNAAGLPDAFSMDDLKAFLDDGEIAALTGADESIMDDAAFSVAPEAEPAAPVAPPPSQPDPQPLQPQIQLPDVADAQKAITDTDAALKALAASYDDGELTRAEWDAQQAALIQQKASAMAQIELAQAVIAQNQQSRAEAWFAKVDAYHSQYPELASQDHIDGWDAALRSVSGSDAYSRLPMEKQIELAHRLYADHVEVTTGQTITRPTAAKAAAPTAPTGPRTDPRPEAPRTLTNLAGLEPGADADDGTFAAIDRMMNVDPERAEQMLSRLPPERQAAYLG